MKLVATPDNPVPEGAEAVEVKTQDGFRLRALRLVRPSSRGTVVVLGGRGDFMERYFETMRDLSARGFSVASIDVRGQGGSQRLHSNPARGHLHRFEELDEDFRAFMTQVVLPDCPQPYFALAHSTGAMVLLRALQTRTWFRKAVVTAPLIDLNYGKWPLPVAKFLTALTTGFGFGWLFLPGQNGKPLLTKSFANNPLTLDRTRWNRDFGVLETAPRLGVGGPTFAWLDATLRAIAKLKKLKPGPRLRCPVLIVAAGLERVVDNEAIHEFSHRVHGVSVVTIRESLHEILNERDSVREQFLAAFDTFVG
jgi:lysophospholipase